MTVFPVCRILLLTSLTVPMVSAVISADRAGESAPAVYSLTEGRPARNARSPDAQFVKSPNRIQTDPVARSGDLLQRGTGDPASLTKSMGDELPAPSRMADEIDSCGKCSCACTSFHRAGHPEYVSWLAIPSNSCRYGGYYVGGGLPLRGEQRCAYHEGTWGWDYFGVLFPKHIALNWGHGVRAQGGTGAYKTDGPKLRHE